MSQYNVLKCIKNSKKPVTSIEIARKTNVNCSSINTSLLKLVKYKEIQRRKVKRGQYHLFEYYIK